MTINPAEQQREQQLESGSKKVFGKPFKPGVSGNPGGRRRGTVSLAAALVRNLTKQDADAIAQRLIALAKSGDIPALRLLFDKLDGAEIEQRICDLEQKLEQQTNT